MQLSTILIGSGWILISYIVYSVLTRIQLSRYHARKAKELQCLPPIQRPSLLPLGIDFILRMRKADKEKRFPQDIMALSEEMKVPTFQQSLIGKMTLATSDPENIKAILATQFDEFEIGKTRGAVVFPLLGNGIFTQNGKEWAHSRAMLRPQFTRTQVSNLDLEERHVQNLFYALPSQHDGWTTSLDLQILFFRLTIDTSTEFLFGTSTNSQLGELPPGNEYRAKPTALAHKAVQFSRAFDQAQETIAARSRLSAKYWLINPKEFQNGCKIAHSFIDHFVQEALERNPEGKSEKRSEDGKFVFLDALTSQTRDPIEIRHQLLHILLAGRDTTASLLSWLFLILSRRPRYYAKLRQHVLADFGSYREDASAITFSKLNDCTFLQHCIKETLRLYPVVPVNARTANKDTTLPRGGGPDGSARIFVPKGMLCRYSVYVMQRRKDLWGPDAEEFVPERWEGRKVGWEYLPFNGGPRLCLGQQFATTEVGYVAVRLLQRFDRMENLGLLGDVRHNLTLSTCPADGVHVRLHKA